MPSGKVSVIRGIIEIAEINSTIGALDAADIEAENHFDEIAEHEVRATPSLCDYASAQRSAMVQSHIAADVRAAMEYTVLAMMGHRGASFSPQPYSMPGKPEMHVGPAFANMTRIAEVSTALRPP